MAGRLGVWTVLILAAVLAAGPAFAGPVDNALKRIYEMSDPVVENILVSMRDKNYEQAVKDFDDVMLSALPPSKLGDVAAENMKTIGVYEPGSKKHISIAFTEDGYIVVQYECTFTNESPVVVRVVYKRGDAQHKVTGLWFDSAKLRQQIK